MDAAIQAFIDSLVSRLYPLHRQAALAYWNTTTTGKEEYQAEFERLQKATMTLLANRREFEQVRAWYKRRDAIADATLRRQVELAYFAYAANQRDAADIERIAALEAELEVVYSNFRASFDGRALSDNELVQILKEENDSALRRRAWEASKQVGAETAERVKELVGVRNRSAGRLGYRDHYARALALQEIDEQFLFATLAKLEELTNEPFRAMKATLDSELSRRFAVPAADLRPWHYADPFFQEAPAGDSVNTDRFFQGKDVVALALQTYDGIGLDVRDILGRSDLYERERKNQHAYCIHIDRLSDDVRILCNLRPDSRWMGTLLHELGHGIYDKYIPSDLPYLLRDIAHINMTEAIALLMERLSEDPAWLQQVLGMREPEVQTVQVHVVEQQRRAMLIFVRWVLVMVHFERDLYADPRRPDLNKLWWDYVERFQFLSRPERRDAPDWAAKLHLATAPVYYHNYLLGQLIASQLHRLLTANMGATSMAERPVVGQTLCQDLFALGARYEWNETLRRVTGEALNPAYFVRQFVTRQ